MKKTSVSRGRKKSERSKRFDNAKKEFERIQKAISPYSQRRTTSLKDEGSNWEDASNITYYDKPA